MRLLHFFVFVAVMLTCTAPMAAQSTRSSSDVEVLEQHFGEQQFPPDGGFVPFGFVQQERRIA